MQTIRGSHPEPLKWPDEIAQYDHDEAVLVKMIVKLKDQQKSG